MDRNDAREPMLEGKVCLITGAGSGIGRATALLFAERGAEVIAVDRDGRSASEVVRQITAAGGRGEAAKADVSDSSEVSRMAAAVFARHPHVHVLFNNAGISAVGQVHDTSEDVWDQVVATNLRSVFLVCRAIVPNMLAHGGGSIINMSSVIATFGLPNRAAYAASKGAILALTKSMQVDYANSGVRVNAILPGTIFTPLVDNVLAASFPTREEAIAAIQRRQLSAELGSPDDVAKAAAFLASDESRFVMGAGLVVDAGVSVGKR